MEPILWDGARLTLHQITETMRDCFLNASDLDGVLVMKAQDGGERPVPLGWYVSRSDDGHAVITQEKPVA